MSKLLLTLPSFPGSARDQTGGSLFADKWQGLDRLHSQSEPGNTARKKPALRIVIKNRFAVVCFVAFIVSKPADLSAVDYNRDVRPILSNKCFKCHGPDAKERQAGLRFDTRDGAVAKLDSGAIAVVPGQVDASELVKRIFSTDADTRMPPAKEPKQLTDAERETLRKWVADGAEFQFHWSFVAPVRPGLPAVRDATWPRNDIDRFILARLETAGLRPSPEASKETLLRRVTLDLTGLPPTLAEIDAFLADNSPGAYETVVDRLLGSVRYGERMALEWLDAARFADTHGFHIDSGRDMSRWREWVIDAFYQNKPFDQFTIEQLAGDLLPNATLDQQVASGFNRNHMINFEGGAIPDEYHTAYIVDRVNTTSTVWLGLTLGCSQCHDHKYDPFTQREFYQLFAFFYNVPESGLDGSKGNAMPFVKAPTTDQKQQLEQLASAIGDVERQLAEPMPEVDAKQRAWESELAKQTITTWRDAKPLTMKGANGTKLKRLDNLSIDAFGTNPATETYSLQVQSDLPSITAIRLETLTDKSLAGGGPGRSINGNIVMTNFSVALSTGDVGKPLPLANATADFSQQDFPVANAIDADPKSGWAIYPEVGKPHEAIFSLREPLVTDGKSELTITLDFQSGFAHHQLGRFRLTVTDSKEPHGKQPLSAEIATALAVAPDQRTDLQRATLRDYYRQHKSPECQARAGKLAELQRQRNDLDTRIPTAMVMQEMPAPRKAFILERGQYDKKGAEVVADVPAVLPKLPEGASPNRLGLAQWLVHPAHPLTARVTVNRFWQALFGTGLVKTSEDFGSQGEQPSHRELLDWLAVEFRTPSQPRTHGWDVRAMIKLIVMSASYRQSSRVTPALLEKDPENRLLARGPRQRLQAEFVRDQALAISGLLDPRVGGKSVFPYQPAGLWEELMSREDGKNWTAQSYTPSQGADLYRRSMYTFWKRTSPPAQMATFDAPDRETCTVRRATTNTPLQALILLNDPTYVEAARKFAERILMSGPTTETRLAFAFRSATARHPSPQELTILRKLHDNQVAAFSAKPEATQRLLKVGESIRNEDLAPAELAAWTTVASTLLNLDETIVKN